MTEKFKPMNFNSLLGTPGFSDELLKNHFTLYQGYVKNSNTLYDDLNEWFKKRKPESPEYAEMRRRFAWEFNGMRLHEYYFGNLSKAGASLDPGSALARKIVDQFGSFHTWERDFKDVSMMRGIGWAIFCYDPATDHLFNTWINEHDQGFLAGTNLILILDAFEHAYVTDYGLKRDEYISAFLRAADWETATERFNQVTYKELEFASR